MISSRLCFLLPTPNISRIFVEICASRGTSDSEKYLLYEEFHEANSVAQCFLKCTVSVIGAVGTTV